MFIRTYTSAVFVPLFCSAFKKETTELANQTRRLGRGIRELAETSPQLREVVRALSGRVDGLKTEGEVKQNADFCVFVFQKVFIVFFLPAYYNPFPAEKIHW